MLVSFVAIASFAPAAQATDRYAITSYDRMQAGAPHHNFFNVAWQPFTAQSNRITLMGVTVGNPSLTAGQLVNYHVTIKLCTNQPASTAPYSCSSIATASPQIVNYGNTQVDIGDVPVNQGSTYYLAWYQPPAVNGKTWVTFWWTGGSTITTSDTLQMLVRGFDSTTYPTYHVYGTGGVGLYERSGPGTSYSRGPLLSEGTSFQIACQTKSSSYVNGSNVWDQLTSDGNYVSDFYTNTPIYADYSPGLGACGAPPPTLHNSFPFHVYGTGGIGLRERSGPSVDTGLAGLDPEGATVNITCQARTLSAVGGSTIWDQLDNSHWVSDYYIDTPVYNQFTSGIPVCGNISQPPTASTYHVQGTNGLGLRIRTGPGLGYPYTGAIPEGGNVDIACQVRTSSVANGSSIWDQVHPGGWVADGYVSTPAVDHFTTGIPQCAGSYPPPSFGFPVRQTFGQPGRAVNGTNPTRGGSDPVDTATGSYWTTATDVSVPAIGVALTISRTYNSQDNGKGPFGPGWSFSLGAELSFDEQGDVILHAEDGQQTAYEIQPDGLIVPAPGGQSQLVKKGDGSYLLTRRDQTQQQFDATGRLTRVLDRNGDGLKIAYANSTATVTAEGGRTATIQYDAGTSSQPGSHLITQITLGDGRDIQYGYTGGLLTSVTDVRGNTTSYEYDDSNRLAKITDANGNVQVGNLYGADGRVVKQTDGLGNVSTFAWDPTTQTSTMTDSRGHRWTDVYDNNVLVTSTDPLGDTTTYQYDGDMNLVAKTDADGNTTTYTYDNRGNTLTQTAPAPLSLVQTWTYDSLNDTTTFTNGSGNEVSYTYDSSGNLSSETRPGGVNTSYQRDPQHASLVSAITDPLGNTTSFTYDSSGDRISLTTPLGNETTMTYDDAGRMRTMVDARGNAPGANPDDFRTASAYDPAGDLVSVTDPLGDATTYTYDGLGNKTSITDANGHVTAYSYDADNRLSSVTAPDGGVTTYAYDPTGNVIQRTDANGHMTAYAFDAANRQTSMTTPMGRMWSYGYDPNGNKTSITLPGLSGGTGPVVTNTFDALNRLTGVSYNDGTPGVTYSYDADNNRRQMQDGQGTEVSTYDALDRLVTRARGQDEFAYTYDADSHVLSRTYPDGSTTDYTYDADGRLLTAQSAVGTTSYAYDPDGNRVRTNLPSATSLTETRTYDRTGRVLSVLTTRGAKVQQRLTYAYDGAGNPLDITNNAHVAKAFTYDQSNRVTEVCYGVPTCANPTKYERYIYDAVGNRLTRIAPTGTSTYAYNADDELTAQSGQGAMKYAYDQFGNETNAGSAKYAYDAANRLTSETHPLPPAPYAPTILADHPLGYWRLGDALGSSVAADGSGGGNDGTYMGGTLGAPGLLVRDKNTAVSFNGTTDYVSAPALPIANSSFSIEAWIKPTSTAPATQVVFAADGGAGNDNSLQLSITDDGRANLSYQGEVLSTPAGHVHFGKASQIVATYDASTDRSTIYINGRQWASGPQGPFTGNPPTLSIGRWNDSAPNNFAGIIDDVAVFGTALSSSSVLSHYRAGVGISNGTSTTTYTYDGDGNRLSLTSNTDSNAGIQYLWDSNMPGVPQLAIERDVNGNNVREYTYGAGRISMSTGGQNYLYNYDALGSVTGLTSSSGSLEWSYSYSPYGVVTATKLDFNAPSNPMKFVGEYQGLGGLYDLRARQYDVTSGRLLTADPVLALLDQPYSSAYSYVEDRPTILTDPSGQWSLWGTVFSWTSGLSTALDLISTVHDLGPWPALVSGVDEGFRVVQSGRACSGSGPVIDCALASARAFSGAVGLLIGAHLPVAGLLYGILEREAEDLGTSIGEAWANAHSNASGALGGVRPIASPKK